MTPATKELHENLIRLLKGLANAWEKWLNEQKPDSLPADPKK